MLAAVAWFLAGVLLPGRLVAAAVSGDPDPGSATAAFQAVAAAWRAGDARALAQHLGDHKVTIALEGGPSGRFSRDQTYSILTTHFAATQTQQFQFTSIHDPGNAGRVAVALAERLVRDRGSGRVVQDRVLVALVPAAGNWVVSEIRALR